MEMDPKLSLSLSGTSKPFLIKSPLFAGRRGYGRFQNLWAKGFVDSAMIRQGGIMWP